MVNFWYFKINKTKNKLFIKTKTNPTLKSDYKKVVINLLILLKPLIKLPQNFFIPTKK